MNPFEAYSKKALSTVSARLIGPIKTRPECRERYTQIVAEIGACQDLEALYTVLAIHRPTIIQFHAEMPFLWHGDGQDFLGLDREIERAFETVEAATFFRVRATESEVGRIPANQEVENRP